MPPTPSPTGAARTEAGHRLEDPFIRIDQELQGAPQEETEKALDEAIRDVHLASRERG